MTSNIIQVQHVSKIFGGLTAVNAVDLEVSEGSIYSILKLVSIFPKITRPAVAFTQPNSGHFLVTKQCIINLSINILSS
jgi:ABC-type uncharacterized transport system ATPase subunit